MLAAGIAAALRSDYRGKLLGGLFGIVVNNDVVIEIRFPIFLTGADKPRLNGSVS